MSFQCSEGEHQCNVLFNFYFVFSRVTLPSKNYRVMDPAQ